MNAWSEIPKSQSVRLLQQRYRHLASLHDYLSIRTIHGRHPELLQATDVVGYQHLLKATIVAFDGKASDSPVAPASTVWEEPEDIVDVVNKAISAMFFGRKANRANVLAQGYQDSSWQDSRTMSTSKGLTHVFTNTNVTYLQTNQEWQLLLERIGSNALISLLTDTSLFLSLKNDCFLQLCGTKLSDLCAPTAVKPQCRGAIVRKNPSQLVPASSGQKTSLKRTASIASLGSILAPETGQVAKKHKTGRRSANDILLQRSFILHGATLHASDRWAPIIGLSPENILNSTPASDSKADSSAQERRCLEHIFPRGFGLRNIFDTETPLAHNNTHLAFKEREAEIHAKTKLKTPKRLKTARTIISALLAAHANIDYKAILDKTCPIRLKHSKLSKIETEALAEYTTAEPRGLTLAAQLAPSININFSFLATGRATPIPLKKRKEVPKPRFAEFACSHGEMTTWGSEHNQRRALDLCDEIIRYKRLETLTLHHALQGFRINNVVWLQSKNNGTRSNATEEQARMDCFSEFVYWFISSWLFDLLKTTFYITETSALGHRCLYFRRDDWKVLCKPLVDEMADRVFKRIKPHEAEALMHSKTLGFSKVRLLPKETGVRPIVNLAQKSLLDVGSAITRKSTNEILADAFAILKHEAATTPAILGSSSFGWSQTYQRLQDFKNGLLRQHKTIPQLYFVKVDVQACFDTIKQEKMLDLLVHVLLSDAYTITEYGTVQMSSHRPRRSFKREASSSVNQKLFVELADVLCRELHSAILVDRVKHRNIDKEDLMALLREHVNDNIVKIGNILYRQCNGIPQGSVLSSLLCNFFYAEIEHYKLDFTIGSNNLLVRQIDDFLFVSADFATARQFLVSMAKGFPDYGCTISRGKTVVNFHVAGLPENQILGTETGFPYCGLLIDQTALTVQVDYAKHAHLSVGESLCVERSRSPGVLFRRKMLHYLKVRSHPIFTTATFNTPYIVLLNVYQNFLLTSMRFVAYIKAWKPRMSANPGFFISVVRKIIATPQATIPDDFGRVSAASIAWLGRKAFQLTLSRQPTKYQPILKMLGRSLARSKRVYLDRRVQRIIKDPSNSLVLQLQF